MQKKLQPHTCNYFDTAQLIALVALFITYFWVLFANINSGYELGDHGFYLLHLRQPDSITITLTHFGLVWNFLFGEHGIIFNRIVNIAFIMAAGVSLIVAMRMIIGRADTFQQIVASGLIACAAYGSYFSSFILDPSYNSLSLALVTFGVTSIATTLHLNQRGKSAPAYFVATTIGMAIAGLILTKASTALIFSVFALIALLAFLVATRSSKITARLFISALLGFGAVALALQLTTGMISHVVNSFLRGIEIYNLSETSATSAVGLGALKRVYDLLRGGVGAMLGGGWAIAALTVVALVINIPAAKELNERTRSGISALAASSIIGLAMALVIFDTDREVVNDLMISTFFIGGFLTLGFWLVVPLTVSGHVLVAGSILVPFFTIFGTSNGYIAQVLYIGPALTLLPAWIVLSGSSAPFVASARKVLLALAGSTFIFSAYSAYINPYRIGGDLASAEVPIEFPGGERLNVTSPIARFIEGLKGHEHPFGKLDEAPVVFDLTGQLPIAVHLLNGRAPRVAWMIDSFGSGFSRTVFADIDHNAFLSGWVLVRLGSDDAIDRNAPHFKTFSEHLNDLGKNFDAHYETAANLTAPNWGRADQSLKVRLYKPRKLTATPALPQTQDTP